MSQNPARSFTLDAFTDATEEPAPGFKRHLITADLFNNPVSDSDTGISGTDLGERTIELKMFNGSGSVEVLFNPNDSSSTASVSATSGSDIEYAKFTWGSESATPQNFRDISGHDSLAIEILSIDLVEGADFQFTVIDSSGHSALSSIQQIESTGTQYFSYNDFETNNPSINLNAIRQVELKINNSPIAFDTTFDFIQSAEEVPFEFSPTLGIIIGGSFLGFNILRKRSKQK
ncbi:MAG: hypothetical protein QNJ55_10050 [Xenococcus sp. MO_188.B8]|nr:hypothetical protein [Xenococcus sp. MO_188.B8]